ncbi:MAG: elongation factor G [Fusobacteriaceae bacterium]
MISYDMKEIRNVAFLGHRGCGKTSLMESLLFMSGSVKKKGSVEEKNTISDFDKEEMKRAFSINTSVIPIEHGNHKYNLLDTPGYFDFFGEVYSAIKVVGGAVVVIDTESGVEVGTEKIWDILEKNKTPRLIFLNKMDKGIKDYKGILNQLKEKFGKKVAPFCIPIIEKEEFKGFVNVIEKVGMVYNGKECIEASIDPNLDIEGTRTMLLEAVAETDEKYMEKYFAGEEFTLEEINDGLHRGVCSGDIVPVLMGSSVNNVGVSTLLNMMYRYMPTPSEMNEGKREGKNLDGGKEEREVNENFPFSAMVFKTFVDPFMGKISLFKVNSGILKKDTEVLNSTRNKKERISNIMFMRGNQQISADEVRAGDIGATSKLQFTQTGDTLCCKENPIIYDGIEFPKPTLFYSIEPKDKNDDEKLSTSVQKIIEEDPTFVIERNSETKEMLLGCQGEKHLNIALSRAENKFGVHALASEPKIPYRETIRDSVTVQGKHKKQSGGAGQFGDVHIKFEHIDGEEFVFVDDIHGGVVPKSYIPAVEKGILEGMKKGALAGYPVINIKATLFDGSYHSVDSNEMSFKMAGIQAFRKAMEQSKPVLLEPIMKMEIVVPEESVGDIMGDLNKRRGKILGIEMEERGKQRILAEVPHNEILKYSLDLRSMTQGRGEFTFKFSNYSEIYGPIADKIVADTKK